MGIWEGDLGNHRVRNRLAGAQRCAEAGFMFFENEATWLPTEPGAPEVEIYAASPVEFRVRSHQFPVRSNIRGTIRLGNQHFGPFDAVPRSIDETTTFRLRPPLDTALLLLDSLEAQDHRLHNVEQPIQEHLCFPELGRHLDVLCSQQAIGRLKVSPGTWLPALLRGDRHLHINWRPNIQIPAAPYVLEVAGHYSDFLFEIGTLTPNGKIRDLISGERTRRRSFRRVTAPPGVTLCFEHPEWPGYSICRKVIGFSLLGLAIECEQPKDLLWPGLALEFGLHWKGCRPHHFIGQVRHVGRQFGRRICGIEVFAETLEDERAWQREISPVVYPDTSIPSAQDDNIWELYKTSGYLELSGKSPAEFAGLKSAWEQAHKKFCNAPHLFTQVVRHARGHVAGTLSISKIWSNAVLGYHMARRQDDRPLTHAGNETLRALHCHAYELAQYDGAEWFVGYVQDAARLSRAVHLDFPARYTECGRAAVVPFRAIEIAVPCCQDSTGVTHASPTDIVTVLEYIAENRPRPYVEAHDFVGTQFAMKSLVAACKAVGAKRDRFMMVLKSNGRTRAAIILDAAEEGLHLFGLLDLARLIVLEYVNDEEIMKLIGAASRWFETHDKKCFIFIDERCAPISKQLKQMGAVDLGGASCTIMHRSLIPDMLEHLATLTHEEEQV